MGYVRSYFEIGQHPTKMANLLLAANLFRRGDTLPAALEITMALTPDKELGLLQNTWAWGVFSSSQLGVSGKLAFTNRLNTSVGTSPSGRTTAPAAPSGNELSSDTGQLRWDTSLTNRGLVTVNTSRTKALIGFADNRPVPLGGVTLTPGTTKLGWCTLGVTLTRGEVFTNDCTALIIASGWWENTGQVWTDATKTSLGSQWGQAPVLTEVVPFTLSLPVGTNFVHCWSLDEQGGRKAPIPVSGTFTSSTVTVGTNAASIWYELSIDRWMASFELWRARYFSATELTNSALSGEAATPDGDHVANLWKYYLGLPGRTPVSSDHLPQGALVQRTNRQFLAMTFQRDTLATDVMCQGQVSGDLLDWLTGPAYTLEEPAIDLGNLEAVTVRDRLPVGNNPSRYLRLGIQRR